MEKKPAAFFQGISEEEKRALLKCLSPVEKQYQKEEILFSPGALLPGVGYLTEGSVLLQKEDYWGNRRILARLFPGDIFGESYVCLALPLDLSVQAADACRVLFMDIQKLLTVCSSACPFHNRLVKNLMNILAEKNRRLTQKLDCTAPRKIRDRLAAYFSQRVQETGSDTFEIPFTRQQLADYLYVDRSAMTTELYKMMEEGLLTFHKNRFTMQHRFAP